jgi:hypothetical protein
MWRASVMRPREFVATPVMSSANMKAKLRQRKVKILRELSSRKMWVNEEEKRAETPRPAGLSSAWRGRVETAETPRAKTRTP